MSNLANIRKRYICATLDYQSKCQSLA